MTLLIEICLIFLLISTPLMLGTVQWGPPPTDYILDETFTLLFRRLPFEVAKRSLKIIEEAILNQI